MTPLTDERLKEWGAGVAIISADELRAMASELIQARKASIEAIALLDMALMGTLFTKPRTGQIIINRERAEKVLADLRAARQGGET
jgi:hypothetical protein